MASTRIERDHIVSAEVNGIPDVRGTHMVLTAENENAAVANRGDFFSMFYLPSSQSYDEDVHFTSSSYSAPFQGAASVVMGGILSVLDTALAVMNEFDNSDSIISDSTKDEDEDVLQGNVSSCVSSERRVIGCYENAARSQLSTPCTSHVTISTITGNKSSHDKTSGILENSPKKEINVHDLSLEESGAQESDDLTLHISRVGSISTLQMFEGDTGDAMKKLLSDLHSESMDDMQIETDTGSKAESRNNEDSEYCIIKNERETDGWLFVCDD